MGTRLDPNKSSAMVKLGEILGHVSYKPGFFFSVLEDPVNQYSPNHVTWRIDASVPDSNNGDEKTYIVQKHYMSSDVVLFADEATLLDTIYRGIRSFEDHELQEWFRFKGNTVYDPHPEGNDEVQELS